jgi:ABC-2 type transport system ATP-binding protein
MKVLDQLRFFAELKNVRGKGIDAKIDEWLARLKLSEWKNKRSMELSKGMQQKIQFITCVIHDPDLLILDEPFSGLDPINVELLKEVVLDLKRAGKTIIFSTHQMEVAEKICDDICLLNKSQKVFEGSLRDIKRSFGRNSVAVRCEGGDGVLDDPALVSKLVRHVDEAQALLAEGADAQVLLKRLIAAGAVIGKFEMVEPSLNDIFITKVTEAA